MAVKRVHFDVKNDRYYEFEQLIQRSVDVVALNRVDDDVWDAVSRQVVWQVRSPVFESLGREL
jgi:hypothetical protein